MTSHAAQNKSVLLHHKARRVRADLYFLAPAALKVACLIASKPKAFDARAELTRIWFGIAIHVVEGKVQEVMNHHPPLGRPSAA